MNTNRELPSMQHRRVLLAFASLLALGLLHPVHGFASSSFSVRSSTVDLHSGNPESLPGTEFELNGRSKLFAARSDQNEYQQSSRFWKGLKSRGSRVSSRLDALAAAGLVTPKSTGTRSALFLQSTTSIGLGLHVRRHSGLLLASTLLVFVAKAFWKTVQQARGIEDIESGDEPEVIKGVMSMDRCPWPFIFSHDIAQGFKDPQTWILFTWIVLWRITKVASNGKI